MKKALVGFWLFLVPILLQASYVCSPDEITEFDKFLAGNKANFENRLNELYSEEDPCANILYVKLVDLVDDVSTDMTKKADMCATALDFCKNNKDTQVLRQPLHNIVEPDCMKGTSFGINRAECKQYFNL